MLSIHMPSIFNPTFIVSANDLFTPNKKKMKGWYIRIKRGGGIGYHIHNSWLSGVFYSRVPRNIKNGKL